jgi:hypothetical protein
MEAREEARMDEEKKSEVSGEGAERLEPYVIQAQVEQSHDSQGECYLAKNETSGGTALVRKHTAEEGAASRGDWVVVLGCWASRGYSSMDVVLTGWARALDKQSAEALLFTLEAVLEEVRRMLRAVSGPPEPRFRWRGVVGAATVCALLFALVRLAPVSQPPSAPPAPLGHEALTAAETPDFDAWLANAADAEDAGQSVFARPLPKEPLKGQKRPPCTRYVEVELVGACWAPHKLKAPCPQTLFEHEGECFLPSLNAKPSPSSLGQ